MRGSDDQDKVKAIGELWNRQDEGWEFDYELYNSMPWVITKTVLALCIITLTFLLYGLHEMPWTIYGSGTGLFILLLAPLFAGMILGYTFEKPKWALLYSIIIGFGAIVLNFILLTLPATLDVGYYEPGFMSSVWWYGFYLPFMITISSVPAGAMIAASTNVYE